MEMQTLVRDGLSESLARLVVQRHLCNEAARLRFRLTDARNAAEWGSEQHRRVIDVMRRLDDRISRREWTFSRTLAGKPTVTTAQVAAWVTGHIADYRGIDGADSAEVAGAVCEAFDLWDDHGSIPDWVHGVCERLTRRDKLATLAAQDRPRATPWMWAEKPLCYEDDGQIIWA
jgi:hypothetical protein